MTSNIFRYACIHAYLKMFEVSYNSMMKDLMRSMYMMKDIINPTEHCWATLISCMGRTAGKVAEHDV